MIKFDLDRALAGDALVTRGGDDVTGFRRRNASLKASYPYIIGNKSIYTSAGKYWHEDRKSTFDLFMKFRLCFG